MSKSFIQKLRLLYLKDILLSKTDENNSLTIKEIQGLLELHGIEVERKTLYQDFELLRSYGVDIISNREKSTVYYAVGNKFELAELKLLVDSVQSSRFITYKKSTELISKIQSLCSVYDAQKLQRQVFVGDRVKNINEEIYYNVDQIYTAIGENKKISFRYFEYTTDKSRKFKKNDNEYFLSPMALLWGDQNYYLLAYDDLGEVLKHYRVDKMVSIKILNETRDFTDKFDDKQVAKYNDKVFAMFGGKEETVKLMFSNKLVGVVLDRFGKDIIINKHDENYFTINVKVEVSPQFYGWLSGLGIDVRILAPEYVKNGYINHLEDIISSLK